MCSAFYDEFVAPRKGMRKRVGKLYEWKGVTHSLKEWSEILDISLNTLYRRVDHGHSGDRLFATERNLSAHK